MSLQKAPAPRKLRQLEVAEPVSALKKCPTGIRGFDEITLGGLPQGRPTLIVGSAGCGKTLFGMEFLVRGAMEFGENGVCISFEETAAELAANTKSLGYHLADLIKKKKIAVDYIYIERSQIEETGEYDLEALFLRIDHAVRAVGAKRVLLDSLEALFAGLTNQFILRSELRRLFRWLKERNLTAVITAERGENTLTRQGLEEYISDCVILLDHRVSQTILTRNLRVVKYRGSLHGTNEYPFLIESDGISVLPVTSVGLNHAASKARVGSGVPALDDMLGGKGYYRGSTILVSGTAGTGKSSLAAHFLDAACARGEKSLYLSYEESPEQIMRNMRSIGIYLKRWVDKGLLQFQSSRPTTFGLEMHLAQIHRIVREFDPAVVVIDPITSLLQSGTESETSSMLLRLVDFLKSRSITAMLTTLTAHADDLEQTGASISSLVDAWLLVRDIEMGGERNRGLYLLKARGIAHSNQIREFLLTKHGIELREVYLGEAGLLTGSARITQEVKDTLAVLDRRQLIERKQLLLDRKRQALEAQIASLQADLESDAQEVRQLDVEGRQALSTLAKDRLDMATSRLVSEMLPRPNGAAATSHGGHK
jgi:circadian clock protein KaiC